MERHDVEEGKENSARLGAQLISIDESGFVLTPSVRRTWAPAGQTPVVHHHFANDRISGISRISVSPLRHRLGLSDRSSGTTSTEMKSRHSSAGFSIIFGVMSSRSWTTASPVVAK
jgi:hypothetical protein